MGWISFYDGKVIGRGHEQIMIDDAVFGGSTNHNDEEMGDDIKRNYNKSNAQD